MTSPAVMPVRAGADEDVLAGLREFVRRTAVGLHEEHGALLGDPRRRYAPDGRYAEEVVEIIREVRMRAAQAGYYAMLAPAELGGGGLGSTVLYDVWEDLHHHWGPHHWLAYHTVAHWAKGPSPALLLAHPDLRAEVLPTLLSGERTMCFAMSEPDAGSDAWRMRTRASALPGGGWEITGTKQWISNGSLADLALVLAVTDPELAAAHQGGITAFLVPTDAPGFRVDSTITMFGQVGGHEAILSLDRIRVTPEQVVGEVHRGFDVGLGNVARGRLYNAAKSVGLARWGLERAAEYAQARRSGGSPIARYQGVTFPLAESAMEVAAAHALGVQVARRHEDGTATAAEVAMAKALSTEVGARALDRVMQTHGAMGFTSELGLTAAWQMLRVLLVADGTAETLRRVVARGLLAGELVL